MIGCGNSHINPCLQPEDTGRTIERFNAAICGNTAADLVKRLERDVISLHPDLVSICIGVNDCPVRPVAD